jgi:hypothetical protein
MRARDQFDHQSRPRRVARRVLPWAWAVLASAAWGAAPEPAWLPATDGASVVDPLRKLVWDRCVHGQRWGGQTCAGTAEPLSHAEGMALAAERNRTGGKSCRLPSVPELQALAATNAAAKGKKPALFPADTAVWRWSGTRIVNTATVNQYNYGNVMAGRNNDNAVRVDVVHGWAVDVTTGDARKDITKRTRMPIQLVCALP